MLQVFCEITRYSWLCKVTPVWKRTPDFVHPESETNARIRTERQSNCVFLSGLASVLHMLRVTNDRFTNEPAQQKSITPPVGNLKPESCNPTLYIVQSCPWAWHLNQIASKSPAQHKWLLCQVRRCLKASWIQVSGKLVGNSAGGRVPNWSQVSSVCQTPINHVQWIFSTMDRGDLGLLVKPGGNDGSQNAISVIRIW